MKLDKVIEFLKNEHLRFWACLIYVVAIFLTPSLITPPIFLTLIVYLVWSASTNINVGLVKIDYKGGK